MIALLCNFVMCPIALSSPSGLEINFEWQDWSEEWVQSMEESDSHDSWGEYHWPALCSLQCHCLNPKSLVVQPRFQDELLLQQEEYLWIRIMCLR